MSKFDADTVRKSVAIIRMLSAPEDKMKLAAVYSLLRLLAGAKLDIHDLAERIEMNSDDLRAKLEVAEQQARGLNQTQVQKIYDAAYQKGFSDGSDHGRRTAIVAAPSTGTFSAGSGVNGYTWHQIAAHCAANIHLFYGREAEFVESVFRQLEDGRTISTKQAPWLKDIFMRQFSGRIV